MFSFFSDSIFKYISILTENKKILLFYPKIENKNNTGHALNLLLSFPFLFLFFLFSLSMSIQLCLSSVFLVIFFYFTLHIFCFIYLFIYYFIPFFPYPFIFEFLCFLASHSLSFGFSHESSNQTYCLELIFLLFHFSTYLKDNICFMFFV